MGSLEQRRQIFFWLPHPPLRSFVQSTEGGPCTKLSVEAVKANGESAVVYSTEHNVGDVLGGPIDPLFDMTGYTKLRMSCEYYNPRAQVVGWGVGDQEMCVFLAFSDSQYNFGGGVNDRAPPENPLMVGSMMTYSNACTVYANDGSR